MRSLFLAFAALILFVPCVAVAQSFATVTEIQTTNIKGAWKKVSTTQEALLILDDGTERAHKHAADALARLAIKNPDNQAQIARRLVGLLSPLVLLPCKN